MNSFARLLAASPLLLTACAIGGLFGPPSNLQPTYDPSAAKPVIVQVHGTGAIAPPYVHRDTLTINGDGAWQANRVFTYATATPSTYVLATGSLAPGELQSLVNQAFASPRFVDLPASIDDKSVGGGTNRLTLYVKNGSQSVSVVGNPPEAFRNFDQAISTATVDMSKVGPSQAGQ